MCSLDVRVSTGLHYDSIDSINMKSREKKFTDPVSLQVKFI